MLTLSVLLVVLNVFAMMVGMELSLLVTSSARNVTQHAKPAMVQQTTNVLLVSLLVSSPHKLEAKLLANAMMVTTSRLSNPHSPVLLAQRTASTALPMLKVP